MPYTHEFVFEQQESPNIAITFEKSPDEEDELDHEYATIEHVIRSSLEITLAKDNIELDAIQESIESVVNGN